MNTLFIGDLHLNIEKAELIIDTVPHDRVVFMGDYFDDFFDQPEDNVRVAKWLKRSLSIPNRIHLMGNHDYHYMPGAAPFYTTGCGYSFDKYEAINDVLSLDDWSKLKYFHNEQGWWCSHAGVHSAWFGKPYEELTEQSVIDIIEKELKTGLPSLPLSAISHHRGGEWKVGGLLWNDWSAMEGIPNVKQIVGHTPGFRVRFNDEINAYCVDSMPREYIIVADGNVTIHKTPLASTW